MSQNRWILYLILIGCLASKGCTTAHKECADISYEEYLALKEQYAEVILQNKQPQLSKYHGELGDDDSNLCAFLKKYQSPYFEILIQQEPLSDSLNYYISLHSEKVSTTALYVYSNNYSTPLFLYTHPNLGSTYREFNDYINTELYIIDVNGLWLKVTFEYEGKKYIGWIAPNAYCSNPYSTCG